MLTDANNYIPVVTFANQDNKKLQQHLMLGFKHKIHWNKYQTKLIIQP